MQLFTNVGVSRLLETTMHGFLEMTIGQVEDSSAAYMRTYIVEMLLNSNKIYVLEKGAGELT